MNKKEMRPEVEYSTLNQLMAIGKIAVMSLDSRLQEINLSAPNLWALVWLESLDEPPTIIYLADCMSSAKFNITTMIDRLEKEGWVRRVDNPDDRRLVLIEMNEEVRMRYQAGMAVFNQLNQEIRNLSDPDMMQYVENYLHVLRESLLQ